MDYTTTRFEDAVTDVDVVIDLVGDAHDHTSTRSLKVLRPGGLLVAVPAGVSPNSPRPPTPPACGSPPGRARRRGPGHHRRPDRRRRDHRRGRGNLPLEQAGAAHARVQAGRTRGKVVLTLTH
ncbi:zinc-binding dehydrogenase [Streptacidiphilus monticola]